MRYAVLLTVIVMGCGQLSAAFKTPPVPVLDAATHPLEIEYELLGTATGQACASLEELHGGASLDPRAIGGSVLLEKAKYQAIEQTEGADGLVAVRTRVTWAGDQQCVSVRGRAYRLLSIRATGGYAPGERSKAPPRPAEIPAAAEPAQPAPAPALMALEPDPKSPKKAAPKKPVEPARKTSGSLLDPEFQK